MEELLFDYDNVGGLANVWAIARSGLGGLTRDLASDAWTIELRPTHEVIRIPVHADETFSFTESHGTDEHGEWWQPTVTGVIPKRCKANDAALERLERGEWILVTEDGNGVLRMSGDLLVSMWISTDGGTGASYSERNGVTFTATCKQSHPSYLLLSLPWDNG